MSAIIGQKIKKAAMIGGASEPAAKDLEQNNFPVCHFDDRRNLKVSKDFSYRRNDSQSVGYFVPVPKDIFTQAN
jgi:hypothetical protein